MYTVAICTKCWNSKIRIGGYRQYGTLPPWLDNLIPIDSNVEPVCELCMSTDEIHTSNMQLISFLPILVP